MPHSEPNRRAFIAGAGSAALLTAACPPNVFAARYFHQAGDRRRPNVIFILTDDQGYGDLGCHGNDKIKTPHIDRLSRDGVEFTQFYVSPLCAPTRASLMTGRYNYRTGVADVYLGRSLMYPDEMTIAQLFRGAGYRTAIFGKWHLGDNYPMRPNERGFEESVIHSGGGIGQRSDPWGNDYFDPILRHNGEYEKYEGYCTNIFFDLAIQYMRENRDNPFFMYLATNSPHMPLIVPESYVEPYRQMGLDDITARTYGMITNIDDNIGRLLGELDESGLDGDTIVIFMTDNGPQVERYNCGLRKWKSSVYEGGIRVPFFVRWKGAWEEGRKIDRVAAHIDVLPTLAEACGVRIPGTVALDGRSLAPLLRGADNDWQDRTIFIQSNWGSDPVLYKNCMARTQQYKMVNGAELYDMENDPGETANIARRFPEILERLKKEYEAWFTETTAERGLKPPKIHIGMPHENPILLTRNDWRGTRGWEDDEVGHWEVRVMHPGPYRVTLRFPHMKGDCEVHLRMGAIYITHQMAGSPWTSWTFDSVLLPEGEGKLEAWLTYEGKNFGVSYAELKKL